MGSLMVLFITTTAPTAVLAQSGPPAQVTTPGTSPTASRAPAQPQASGGEPLEFPKITPGTPMSLRQALEAVDKRNLTLQSARVELEKADAMRMQAISSIIPFIQGNLSFVHNDHADTFDLGGMGIPGLPSLGETTVVPQEILKGTLTVGVPLIRPQSWAQIKAGKKGVALASLTVEQIRQQLLLRVAESYYYALMARQVIALHESTIKTFAEHLKVAKAKLSAGAGLRIDVIRAETDLDQAHQQLLTAHLAFDNARDVLRMLTDAEDLPMPTEAGKLAPPEGSDDDLIKKALNDRRDMITQKSVIDLEKTNLNASWMQLVPTLDSNFQGNYQFTDLGDMGSQDRSRWMIMLQLSIPIYNQFRYADLDYRRAVIRKAMIQEDEMALSASLEVRQQRRNYLTALASVEIAERQADMGHEALTLVQAAYQAGTGSSLEVTDAQRNALFADIALATKKLESQIALLSLLHAIGEDMSLLEK